MVNDTDHFVATMGWNLFHDRRIGAKRFQQFADRAAAVSNRLSDSSRIKDAVQDYHVRFVQEELNPSFLSSENDNNFHDASGALGAPHHSKLLIRVLNLSGMHSVFERACLDGVPEFSDYDRSTGSPRRRLARTDWLDLKLKEFLAQPTLGYQVARLDSHPILAALLKFMSANRTAFPFEPAWVSLWSDFRDHDWHSPKRWHELVGLRPPQQDAWFLLLRYPARFAGRMVRPTQLDGGWYPQHFPVPPSALVGHTMEMNHARRLSRPLPEYIHQQIDHSSKHLFALGRVSAPFSSGALVPPQRRHYGVLAQHYRDTTAWTGLVHPAFR